MAVATMIFRVLSHFFFAGVSRKEKVIKKKRRFCGRCPHPPTFGKSWIKTFKQGLVRTERQIKI